MRQTCVALFSLLLVAGCAGANGGASGPVSDTAAGPPSIEWQTGYDQGVVRVDVVDLNNFYRVEQIALVGPDGQTIVADELTRATVRDDAGRYGYGAPAVGIGGYGSNSGSGLGVGLSFPLGGMSAPSTASFTRTSAQIELPDPYAYRREPTAWSVRVSLTDPSGTPSTATLPAPIPAT